jgi:hypothetical protein
VPPAGTVRLVRRRLLHALLPAAGVVLAVALPPGAAAGQTTPTTDAPDVATVPPTAPAATSTSAPRTPSTTVAPCDPPAPVAVVFTGTVVAVDRRTVTFTVDGVTRGSLPFAEAVVDYPDDSRFLHLGDRYRVTAASDTEVQRLVSKVRPTRGAPARCAAGDPIRTTLPDGTPIDTGLLAGMSGHWGTALWYVVAPLGAAVGVLTALSLVKHTFGWSARAAWRAVRRRRSPRSPRPLGP